MSLEYVALGEIADITKLAGFEFTKYIDYLEEGEIIALRALNLRNGSLDLTDVKYISKEVSESLPRSKLYKNDILLTYTGNSYGDCAIVKENNKYHLAPNIAKITPKKVNPYYLFEYINSKFFKKQMRNYIGGSSQPTIPMKTLRILEIPISDKKTQNKVAKILTDINKKIEVNKKINKNLSVLAKTIFRDRFIFYKGYESHMIKTEYGEIPDTFKVKSINEISKDVVCGKTPSTKVEENYGNEMLFITIPDMHGNVFVINTERKLSEIGIESQIKKVLPKNSICVSCIATAGLVSITSEESQTNQQINSIICKEGISPYFIYLYMKELSDYIKILGSGGSTTLNLNKREFAKIELAIPPQEDMDDFHDQVTPIFEKIKTNQYEIETLQKLRDTLLPKLMSGEIDVSQINCDMQQISTNNWDNKFTVPLQNNLIKVIS